jgi:pyridoxamine 5'-phosphate oxidase
MTLFDQLSEPLPSNPLPLLAAWLEEARDKRVQPNPDAMVLATVGETGRPSARVVLCKQLSVEAGYAVFFTNYLSRKGRELATHPHAAAVFHWDSLCRQVRLEGVVVRSPSQESDRYFTSRALESRIGAWASRQSESLASRSTLEERVHAIAARYGIAAGDTEGDVPRPPHWGGYRLWIEAIELWVEGTNRVHDRAVWKRTLTTLDEFSFTPGAWEAARLYP